ncbi:MAG TPA: hypothetical protein VH189_10835 [Rhizomicrobium sp.]|nr:hypothetical protein [Rhizomicrobium sp.]
MRIAGPFELNARPGLKTWTALPRRCEKSSASSDLGQERPDLNTDRRKGQPTLRVQFVSQNDTSHSDPFWDGPRLLSAFAAQLIGQALPDRRDAALVETTYGSLISPHKALLLDRKS